MMNKDTHLLFEAYLRKVNEGFEYFGHKSSNEAEETDGEEKGTAEEPKKSKHSQSHYHGAAKVIHHALKDKHDKGELTEHMKMHMKKIYGDDYDEKRAEHAIKKAIGTKTEDEEADTVKHPDKELSDRDEKDLKRDTTQEWELSNKKDK